MTAVSSAESAAARKYAWSEGWVGLPARPEGWAHNDIAVTRDGGIVLFDTHEPLLYLVSPDGAVQRSWAVPITEAHGMTMTREGEVDFLWVADIGVKAGTFNPSGQVVKLDLDGQVVARLETPPHPSYADDAAYRPTAVAVAADTGDVWVADGYGQGYVHRFDAAGAYQQTISGEESSGGRFNCPHAVFVDTRGAQPEVYVADRGNAQVQVFDLVGQFVRVVGKEFLSSPSAFAAHEDRLVVAELFGRLAVCDAEDNLVQYLGEQQDVVSLEGWPNMPGPDGAPAAPTPRLVPGMFNSPHGLAVDPAGRIFVSEWLMGGRHVQLAPE